MNSSNPSFHFRLPDWTPQRLIREALVAHGFRHLGEEPIDPETAPWQVLRGIIFAALRRQHSNFDECLRRREGLDEAFRDEMADEQYTDRLVRNTSGFETMTLGPSRKKLTLR